MAFSAAVYTVIFSSGINLLYLALFVLSLIKLKGSVFKKQTQDSCIQMVQTDGREFFQKTLHISLILCTVKFVPDDFAMKVAIYCTVDLLVDAFKYSQIIHLNGLSSDFLSGFSDELSNFSFALTL